MSDEASSTGAARHALLRYFSAPHGLFYETDAKTNLSFVWPLSQVIDSLIAFAYARGTDEAIDEVRMALAAANHYWDARRGPAGYTELPVPPLGTRGDLYYDDNHWLGLNLVEAYKLTSDRRYLRRAQQVFNLLQFGWDNDPSHPLPGGVFWTQKSGGGQSRNTVSTAGAAQLALQLYMVTGNADYLAFGRKCFDWVQTNMKAPNGLYWDHVDLNGAVNQVQWSYNQGLMLGDAVLLHLATGDPAMLDEAKRIASSALDYYGRANRWASQPLFFNSIFFKNLMMLNAMAPEPRYLKALTRYAETVPVRPGHPWEKFRLGRPRSSQLLDQAAALQIHAYSLLALSRGMRFPGPPRNGAAVTI